MDTCPLHLFTIFFCVRQTFNFPCGKTCSRLYYLLLVTGLKYSIFLYLITLNICRADFAVFSTSVSPVSGFMRRGVSAFQTLQAPHRVIFQSSCLDDTQQDRPTIAFFYHLLSKSISTCICSIVFYLLFFYRHNLCAISLCLSAWYAIFLSPLSKYLLQENTDFFCIKSMSYSS